jgi:predicted nucleotidyltransferase component of viral defense system
MVNINRHKLFLFQILKDIYDDIELANCLGFKGGSALLFFYDLPRFSVDLDFNLLDNQKVDRVYEKVRQIILKYGKVFDEAKKYYGLVIVLDYGVGERKLKIEISNRDFKDTYEIKNLMGVSIRVMVPADMFAHKLCALTDRYTVINRDIFDCWFFMQKQMPVNTQIVEYRMKIPFQDYLQKCIVLLEKKSDKGGLNGLGELMDEQTKTFVRNKLRTETIRLLNFYKAYPVLSQ